MIVILNNLREKISLTIGGVGAGVCAMLGGWTKDVETLCILMGIDYLFGIFNAGVLKKSAKTPNGRISSRVGFDGIKKKVMELFMVVIGYRIDITLGINYVRTCVCLALISNELFSIMETYKSAGLKSIKIIDDMIEILTENSEGKNNDNF